MLIQTHRLPASGPYLETSRLFSSEKWNEEKPREKPPNILWEVKRKKRRKEKEKRSSIGQNQHCFQQ
ncbi:hypothetical protein GRJ2_001330400 [Grus japonensis]|uniref:Uncharacterized protein n=1 Tax=Grus japonensis TaxID=30415 RepID=A0ABC9WT93_GRUJA